MNHEALTPMRMPRTRASLNELPVPNMQPSSHRPDH